MTIEQLLNCSAEELASFSNEQILEWFKDDLKYTRPELVEKTEGPRKISMRTVKNSKWEIAKEKAKQLGIDLDDI